MNKIINPPNGLNYTFECISFKIYIYINIFQSQLIDISSLDSLISLNNVFFSHCTIASEINITHKGVYLPISKLHSILALKNLLNLLNFITECCS